MTAEVRSIDVEIVRAFKAGRNIDDLAYTFVQTRESIEQIIRDALPALGDPA